MLHNNLKKLGFTDNQIKIYLTILNHGDIKAGVIIKETNLQRSVVYSELNEFIDRGIVKAAKINNIFLYSVTDIKVILDEINNLKIIAEQTVIELENKRHTPNREVIIHEGKDIIKNICDKNLEADSGSVIYFLGASKFGLQSKLENYWNKYHSKRIKNRIHCKILYDYGTDPLTVEDRNKLDLCEAKYLPFDMKMPIWFNICNDDVAIIIPSENPPISFLIKNKNTAQAMLNYFDYLWGNS